MNYRTKFTKHIGITKRYFHLLVEITEWCENNFGPKEEHWTYTTMFGNTFFEFENEEQTALFLLRWVQVAGYQEG